MTKVVHKSSGSAQAIADELRNTQETYKTLREAAETMLKRMRDLYAALCEVAAPDSQPILQREVSKNTLSQLGRERDF